MSIANEFQLAQLDASTEALSAEVKRLDASLLDVLELMKEATRQITALKAANARMESALTEIEDRAQDQYDGPEDRTHGPYLQLAQQGLGIVP